MAASQNVCWIDKTKGIIFVHGNKAENIQLIGILLLMTLDNFEPVNPKELKAARLVIRQHWTVVNDIGMKDAENSCIAEWMCSGGGCIGKKDNVLMVCVQIDGILHSANVISGIIDLHQTMLVDPVIFSTT